MMARLRTRLAAFLRDTRGSTLIETAIVTPVLLMMGVGTFDLSRMVSHQHELQTGASDAEGIVLALSQGTTTDIQTVRSAIAKSLRVDASKVAVTKMYRCDTGTVLVNQTTDCTSGTVVYTYIRLTVIDTYQPTWTQFGVGQPLRYKVVRTVQVS